MQFTKKIIITLISLVLLFTSLNLSFTRVSAEDGLNDDGDVEISSFDITGVISGADHYDNGDWVWNAGNSARGHRFVFSVAYSISGNVHLPVGAIRITIPRNILKDKNGEFADGFEISLPLISNVGPTNTFGYELSDDGKYIIVSNVVPIDEAIDTLFEVGYYTTLPTFNYYDYDPQQTQSYEDASDPFWAHMDVVVDSNTTLQADSERIPVYINTSARITNITKRYPNMYRNWDNTWMETASGMVPAKYWDKENRQWVDLMINTADYDYLIWEIETGIQSNITQYYTFKLEDHDFVDNTPVPNPADDDLVLIGYKFSGQTVYSAQNYVENQTRYGQRYDWVLTGVKKSTYEATNFSMYEESTLTRWTVDNSITGTVDPQDQVDNDTSKSASQQFSYENHFVPIPGIFKVYKWGNINWNRAVEDGYLRNSPYYWDYASYQLREFANGEVDEIDLLYAVTAYGKPGCYTCYVNKDDMYDWSDPDQYWKQNITYTVTDDQVRLQYENIDGSIEGTNYSEDGSTLLTEGDGDLLTAEQYEFKRIYIKETIQDAVYDESEFSFVPIPGTHKSGEYLTVYVKTAEFGWIGPVANYDLALGFWRETSCRLGDLECRVDANTRVNVIPTEGPTTYDSNYICVDFDFNVYPSEEYDGPITVIGYKVETSNAHYFTKIDVLPVLTLKNDRDTEGRVSRLVDWLLSDEAGDKKNALFVFNEVNHTVKSSSPVYNHLCTDYIYAGGVYDLVTNEYQISERNLYTECEWTRDVITITNKDSSIAKRVTGAANDTVNQLFTVSWKVLVNEQITDNTGRKYIGQESGTFYDLLPMGAILDPDSVLVESDAGFINDFTFETIDNYRGSGRTMLIIHINKPGNYYNAYYDTKHSWDVISSIGKDILNPVAYQTGNPSITDGYPDNGGQLTGDNKDYMSNLFYDKNNNNIPEQFIYSQQTYDIEALTAAISGLYKKVKNDTTDIDYVSRTNVQPGSTYSYLLRYKNKYNTAAKGLVLFDSLENYAWGEEHEHPSDWHGKLEDINVEMLQQAGIKLKVYISTVENLDIDSHHDLTDSSVWKLVPERNWHNSTVLNTAKAIALDMSEGVNGDEFVLEANGILLAYLYMKAPMTAERNSGIVYPETYNNIYISSTLINDLHENEDYFIHQDYTIVDFRVAADVSIHKVNRKDHEQSIPEITFSLSGTSEYGTEYLAEEHLVTTDSSGNATWKSIEVGSYIIQEYACSDDWVLDHTEYHLVISQQADGTVSVTINGEPVDGAYVIENEPRIHTDVEFYKRDKANQAVPIEGVKFKLHTDSSFYGNEITLYATSDASGVVRFTNVERGTYTLKEISIEDENYHLLDSPLTVVVDADGNYTITGDSSELVGSVYRVYNEKLASFSLIKLDNYYKTGIPDVEFTLKGVSSLGTVYEMVERTNASGIITFSGLEPGYYTLQETACDEDVYFLDHTIYTIAVMRSWYTGGLIVYINPISGMGYIYSEVERDSAGNYIFTNQRREGSITVTKRWVGDLSIYRPTNNKMPQVTLYSDAGPDNRYTVWKYYPYYGYYCFLTMTSDFIRTIKTFSRNTDLTEEEVLALNPSIVSDTGSDHKIYVWQDTEGNTYWWSRASVIYIDHAGFFSNWTNCTSIDLDGIDFKRMTDFSKLFYNCQNLRTIYNLDKMNTTNAKTMAQMFDGCRSLTYLELSNFNTCNVTAMNSMFSNCQYLTELDLSSFDTTQVKNMDGMFNSCSRLRTIYVSDLWTTDNVTTGNNMFRSCNALIGGAGTAYSSANVTYSYAHIDDSANPGYMTFKEGNGTAYTDETIDVKVTVIWDFASTEDLYTDDVMRYEHYRTEFGTGPWMRVLLRSGDKVLYEGPTPYSYMTYDYQAMSGMSEATNGTDDPMVFEIVFEDVPARYDYYVEELLEYHDMDSLGTDINYYEYPNFCRIYITGDQENGFVITNTQSTFRTTDSTQGTWVDNGDDTWTFVFNVPDDSVDFAIWESTLSGYICDHPASNPTHPDENKAATITNTYAPDPKQRTGSLLLKKTVVGDEDDDTEFTFLIECLNTNSGGTYGDAVFVGGQAEVTLKNGESVFIDGIITNNGYYEYNPVYKITEIPNGNYETIIPENYTGTLKSSKLITSKVTQAGDVIVLVDNVETETVENNGSYTVTVNDVDTVITPVFEDGALVSVDYDTDGVVLSTRTDSEGSIYADIKIPTIIEVEFINVKKEEGPTGSFTLIKQTDGSEELADQQFTFDIEFYHLTANTNYNISNGQTFHSDSDGEADVTVALRAGESVTFDKLPVGATYRITEEGGAYVGSYEITETTGLGSVSKESDTAQQSGDSLSTARETVEANENVIVTYTNFIFEYVDLKLMKVVSGLASQEAYSFTIEFTGLEADKIYSSTHGNIKADASGRAIKSVFLADGEMAVFYQLPTGAQYQITELANAAIASYSITDENELGKIVRITDANSEVWKGLSTEIETIDAGELVTVTFTNNLEEETVDEISVPLKIEKEVVDDEGNAYQSEVEFSFTVSALTEGAPMPINNGALTTTVTINGAGSATFGNITFNKTGTYEYLITEVIGNEPNCLYDDEVYRVRFTVYRTENGELAVSTEIFDSESVGCETVKFVNRVGFIDIDGHKIWNDNDNAEGFRPAEIVVNLLADGKVIKTIVVTEADDWKFSFRDLPKYSGDHEITYTITEDKVPEYSTKINGFVITNTYGPDIPDTGDHSSLLLYEMMMIFGFLGLASSVLILRKRESEATE